MSPLEAFFVDTATQVRFIVADPGGTATFVQRFIPFLLFLELPLYILIIAGIFRYPLRPRPITATTLGYRPRVTCIITCYSEGDRVIDTVRTLLEQLYAGHVEILPIIDGAEHNRDTLEAARRAARLAGDYERRDVRVIPKSPRGGRVSALNTGLQYARGDIVLAADADTSFDNDMLDRAISHFADGSVVAVSATLRVRNRTAAWVTRFQALEYLLSMQSTRTGLAAFNAINNISGAFGLFRRDFLERIGGWHTGTAEDLDLTLRIQQYIRRVPGLRIAYEPYAIGLTDAPESFGELLRQRLRWEGDLYYTYVRRHSRGLTPAMRGWRNLILTLWYGLLFQLVMPFMIVGYTGYLFMAFPAHQIAASLFVVYVVYVMITLVLYSVVIGWLSERPGEDLRLVPLLPFYPAYGFVMRIWSAVAILAEIVAKTHETTSMAPWWVVRRRRDNP